LSSIDSGGVVTLAKAPDVHLMDQDMDVLTYLTMLSAVSKAPVRVGDPLAFYSVAATVLPVFFLALIYQANVIDENPFKMSPASSRTDRSGRLIGLIVPTLLTAVILLYAVFGEFVALHVLATRTPHELEKAMVGTGLYASGLTLAFQRLILAVENSEAQGPRPDGVPSMALLLVETAFLLMLALGLIVLVLPIDAYFF
jgi:hypothetical protein